MPYSDPNKKQKHNVLYAAANKAAIAERKRKWYQANKESITAKQRAYRREVAKQDDLARISSLSDS